MTRAQASAAIARSASKWRSGPCPVAAARASFECCAHANIYFANMHTCKSLRARYMHTEQPRSTTVNDNAYSYCLCMCVKYAERRARSLMHLSYEQRNQRIAHVSLPVPGATRAFAHALEQHAHSSCSALSTSPALIGWQSSPA